MNKTNSNQQGEKTGLALLQDDVIVSLSQSLKKREESGDFKQLPKWKLDELRKFKDVKLGSLSSKINYIESNKLGEFKRLYFSELNVIEKEFESKVDLFNDSMYSKYAELNKLINENFNNLINNNQELLNSSDLEIENFNSYLQGYNQKSSMSTHLENNISRGIDYSQFNIYSFDIERKFNNIIKFVFDITYFQKFRDIKDMIKKYETDFDKALLFNNLEVAYALFEELGTADIRLKELEKVTFEKVDINFRNYIFNKSEYINLENQRHTILNAL